MAYTIDMLNNRLVDQSSQVHLADKINKTNLLNLSDVAVSSSGQNIIKRSDMVIFEPSIGATVYFDWCFSTSYSEVDTSGGNYGANIDKDLYEDRVFINIKKVVFSSKHRSFNILLMQPFVGDYGTGIVAAGSFKINGSSEAIYTTNTNTVFEFDKQEDLKSDANFAEYRGYLSRIFTNGVKPYPFGGIRFIICGEIGKNGPAWTNVKDFILVYGSANITPVAPDCVSLHCPTGYPSGCIGYCPSENLPTPPELPEKDKEECEGHAPEPKKSDNETAESITPELAKAADCGNTNVAVANCKGTYTFTRNDGTKVTIKEGDANQKWAQSVASCNNCNPYTGNCVSVVGGATPHCYGNGAYEPVDEDHCITGYSSGTGCTNYNGCTSNGACVGYRPSTGGDCGGNCYGYSAGSVPPSCSGTLCTSNYGGCGGGNCSHSGMTYGG